MRSIFYNGSCFFDNTVDMVNGTFLTKDIKL